MFHLKRPAILVAAAALVLVAGCTSTGSDDKGTSDSSSSDSGTGPPAGPMSSQEFHDMFHNDIDGRTIAWVPVGQGLPVQDENTRNIKAWAEDAGFKFELHDPNFDPAAQARIVQQLTTQLPEGSVIMLVNADVQNTASALEAAEDAGIYVISINEASNYKTDGYVGVDNIELGARMAEKVVQDCKAPNGSGKIALMVGQPTSGFDVDLQAGWDSVFKDSGLDIVKTGTTNWERDTAQNFAKVTLQQNPDLCAFVGDFDSSDYGAGLAVQQANLQGKVNVYTAGEYAACSEIRDGLVTASWGYGTSSEGELAVGLAEQLIQAGRAPGTNAVAVFTKITEINSSNWHQLGQCYDGKGGPGQDMTVADLK
jgi:ABC-type sugar transport system substrate-binding protein